MVICDGSGRGLSLARSKGLLKALRQINKMIGQDDRHSNPRRLNTKQGRCALRGDVMAVFCGHWLTSRSSVMT